MARYASSAPSKRGAGMSGSASETTASMTPRPPGTWLMMPATIATAYSPANIRKLMPDDGGNNTKRTPAASVKSTTGTATWPSAIRAPGGRSAHGPIAAGRSARLAQST